MENDETESLLSTERNTTSSLRAEISELQQQVENGGVELKEWKATKKMMQDEIDELQSELENSESARADLKSDLEDSNNRLIVLEQELFEHKSIELELLKSVSELEKQLEEVTQDKADRLIYLEEKCEELLNVIEQMEHGQAIYIAHKNDKIDKALANFVNKFPERKKMNIAFLRESEGVYQFGQKRVYIKIEKGNCILVRVGGGYMNIEDFIWQYTPEETEKIARKDVRSKFSSKLSLQKISDKISIQRTENSPIRSP